MAAALTIDTIDWRVRNVIAKQLGKAIEDLNPTLRIIEDLGADSLDVVELMLVLGNEFNAELDERDAAKLVTVGDVSAYVTDLATGGGARTGA